MFDSLSRTELIITLTELQKDHTQLMKYFAECMELFGKSSDSHMEYFMKYLDKRDEVDELKETLINSKLENLPKENLIEFFTKEQQNQKEKK